MRKLVKGFLVSAVGVMLCAGLLGCSSAETESSSETDSSTEASSKSTEASTPQDLVLIETGWSVDESGYVHYGFGLENPNENYEAQFPVITITGRDADGKIVFSDDQTLSFLNAKGTCHFASQAGNGNVPDTVEFTVSVSSYNWVENANQYPDIYTVSNTNVVKGSYGTTSFTGEVTVNKEWSDVTMIAVSVILRNDTGEIVYGDLTFVDNPVEGQTKPFEIPCYNLPSYASYEIYAMPW